MMKKLMMYIQEFTGKTKQKKNKNQYVEELL